MNKDSIKQIIADIMYMDDKDQIQDGISLFRGYSLSSLDFIDLSFELKQKSGLSVEPDTLWPFNTMMTKPELYANGSWTGEGWNKVCELLNIEKTEPQKSIAEIYDYFTVNYIENYLGQLQ